MRRLPGLGESPGPAQTPLPRCSFPSRVPVVTEEVAREALLSFVNSKCCYGSAAAGSLVIQELKQQSVCRVRSPAWRRLTECRMGGGSPGRGRRM